MTKPEEEPSSVVSTKEHRRRSYKGKYNERFHAGLYRFQDMGKEKPGAKAKGTFGLSLRKMPLVQSPMIVIPCSN